MYIISKKLTCVMSLLIVLLTSSALQAGEQIIALDMAESGNYYLQASVDAKNKHAFLFDTGSGYVALSQRTFKEVAEDALFVRNIYGKMANGKSVSVPLYQIETLYLDGCLLKNIEVAVFAGAGKDILGLNALSQLEPLTLQLSPPQLTVSCNQS